MCHLTVVFETANITESHKRKHYTTLQDYRTLHRSGS